MVKEANSSRVSYFSALDLPAVIVRRFRTNLSECPDGIASMLRGVSMHILILWQFLFRGNLACFKCEMAFFVLTSLS